MKKLMMVFLVLLLIAGMAGTAGAAGKDGLALGAVFGTSFGGYGFGGGDVALALHIPSLPIYWALGLNISGSYLGLRVAGDYYLMGGNLVKASGFQLDWFLGVGGSGALTLGSSLGLSLGARLPIGLIWPIIPKLDLWLDAAPTLGLTLLPYVNFPYWHIPVELGIRYWL